LLNMWISHGAVRRCAKLFDPFRPLVETVGNASEAENGKGPTDDPFEGPPAPQKKSNK